MDACLRHFGWKETVPMAARLACPLRISSHPKDHILDAGHSELGMTQRYMHLSPAALEAAIRLLDSRGNIVATANGVSREAGKV